MARQWNDVDEVARCIVRTVKTTSPTVLPTAQIRVGSLRQISPAGATGVRSGIYCARIRVKRTQVKVATNLRVQVELQTVVMRTSLVSGHVDRLKAGIGQAESLVKITAGGRA